MTEGMDLLVSPELLRVKAESLEKKTGEVSRFLEEIERKAEGSREWWKGAGGEAHRQAFSQENGELQEILRGFQQHIRDLKTIVSQYEKGEVQVQEMIEELSLGVIE